MSLYLLAMPNKLSPVLAEIEFYCWQNEVWWNFRQKNVSVIKGTTTPINENGKVN